jgi:hypothetical protein
VAYEVLEVGRAGSAGVEKGVVPVLRDGLVVARLQAARWKEAASAVVGEREWSFTRQKRELTGRRAADPEGPARLHARQTSAWKGTWAVDLEGVALEMGNASAWTGTHRYRAGGRQVAESGTTGGWSRRPTLTADDELPLDHRVFLLWLELLLQRRAAGLAAATAAGGAAATG